MLDNLSLLGLVPLLNLQLLIDGLLIGSIFALAAYGLALVWGVMNIKNLAQGDFVIMGGYIAFTLSESPFNLHPILSIPLVFVIMFVFGWVLYQTIIRRVIERDLFTSLLATFGLAIVIQQLINLAYGPDVQTIRSEMAIREFFEGEVTIADIKFVSFILAMIMGLMLTMFMKKSRMGRAIRATSQNARAARIMGINTDRVYAFTFSLNAAICGIAGVLISMIWVIQPFFGMTHSIRAFVIVTSAGFGNLIGVILSALGLGAVEQFSGFILGAEFQQATVVGLLVGVLIIRQIIQGRQRQVVQ
ncbi:MAG TPA: branched-chain amino acid ABC transporter permease [Candidatus Lambdaproteobacteria bacterium]|jgi:Branched-chain amino acid ABC-type transport system, permease components|nr:branched-chain amino acid ABC transporter permease [Candidatus Lambdaproteobacteria bacterium]